MNRIQWAGLLLLIGGGAYLVMRISSSGIDKIKRHEALRLTRYKDAAGKWTIGYGHLIKPGENYTRITEAQAEELLRQDLAVAESAVNQVKVPLSQNQHDALVSFVFNVGVNAFQKSTLLRKLNSGDVAGAAAEFPRWKYAGGKINQGLLTRRQREQALFLT